MPNVDQKWDYLDLSSGRYYCIDHGGFCDQADAFASRCHICGEGKEAEWLTNHVQRSLRLINGLQDRSKRSFALATSLFGGLGVLKLLEQPALNLDQRKLTGFLDLGNSSLANCAQFTSLLLLLSSMALFAWSMRQICVSGKKSIPKRTYANWIIFLFKKLKVMERCHGVGSLFLLLSIIALALSLILPRLSDFDHVPDFPPVEIVEEME
jgi:hypothetical protein